MDLHYNKHHQTYITSLNNALKQNNDAIARGDLVKQLELQQLIKFHAGGHVNHTLFWQNLTPPTHATGSPDGALGKAIQERWQSLDGFKGAFEAVALGLQGSGWVWLVKDKETNSLDIITSKDQDIVPAPKLPIVGLDMWEHAYYLQYLNNKKSYVAGIWSVINWTTAENRFAGSSKDVFGDLVGLVPNL